MDKISLCMIVKNEANFLMNCLHSVKDLVDEMIVVDTGSEDATINIAEAYGARVFKTEWDDNFAKARNISLSQASGEWILVLDADETISQTSCKRIKAIVSGFDLSKYLPGFQFKIVNHGTKLEHMMVRLFPNAEELIYTGFIHEQVTPIRKDINYRLISKSNVKIDHYGYHKDIILARNKIERNNRILQRQLKVSPEDPFVHYNLGNNYSTGGDHKLAKEHYTKCITLCNALSVFPSYYQHALKCMNKDKK